MKQAPGIDGLPFDRFSLLKDVLAATEVDVGRCEVLQAFVVAPIVIVRDEGAVLSAEIAKPVVVCQLDAVLEGLVPTRNLAMGSRVIRGILDCPEQVESTRYSMGTGLPLSFGVKRCGPH